MDALFQQVKRLYDNELYENVMPVASIIEATYQSDRSLLTPEQYFLLLMYNANSLFYQKQYRKADIVYRDGLIARKAIVKSKTPTVMSINYENLVEMFPEHEIRYKIAVCMELIKNIPEALTVLNSISNKQRTLKVNMMLGKLSLTVGKYANAITAFKMVVRESPMNLEAMKALMSLGVSDLDISNIVSESNLPIQVVDWINSWLEVFSLMFKCKFSDAISKLETLRTESQFGKNELINVLLGQCYYYNGEPQLALKYLQRAHANNFYLLDGLSTLAAIYASKNQADELEKLTRLYMSSAEYTTEHWLLFAQHFFVSQKYEKATYFAHKACYLNPRNIEACLLKARVFLEMKKYKDAIVQLKLLMQFANYRYEVYDYLITAYIASNKLREAHQTATEACTYLGKTPRTYLLAARPLLSDPTMKPKAKPLLEKALEMNKYYLPAALLLVSLLEEEDDTATAFKLLRMIADAQPSSELYTKIGDLCAVRKEKLKAFQYYTDAINMDPSNRKAINQLEALEKQSSVTMMDIDVSSSEDIDISAYPGESSSINFDQIAAQAAANEERLPGIEEENESLWSDVETEISTNE